MAKNYYDLDFFRSFRACGPFYDVLSEENKRKFKLLSDSQYKKFRSMTKIDGENYLNSLDEDKLRKNYEILKHKLEKVNEKRQKKDEKNEEKEKNKEERFPAGGFILFVLRLNIGLAVSGFLIALFFQIFDDIFSFNLTVLIAETFVCSIYVFLYAKKLTCLVNNNPSLYKVRKRKGIIRLYSTINVLLIILMIIVPIVCIIIPFIAKHMDLDNLNMKKVQWFFIIYVGMVLAKISTKKELNELDFYSCSYCDLLNVMEYEGKESVYYNKEHFHEETDIYEVKGEIEAPSQWPTKTSTEKAEFTITGPTRTVSDGMFQHERGERIYVCNRCNLTEKRVSFDEVVGKAE